ncbi:MAG: transcription antitermination factor NusB [Candidatus Omnitrophica bacterium]|nr:transcription antitermination factor NusB [Candidatus Omnitrophota bacterium]
MRKRTIARECALKVLYQLEVVKEDFDSIREQFWEHNPVDAEVQAFAERIIQGVLAQTKILDETIVRHTENWDLSRMAILDKNILRSGAYELLFMPDIPPKVTINESVNIAKKYSQEDSGKFVNGVLDHINHHENITKNS